MVICIVEGPFIKSYILYYQANTGHVLISYVESTIYDIEN